MKVLLLAMLATTAVARPARDKLTAILYQLTEEQLSILEGTPGSWEEMQGDAPYSANDTKSIKDRDKEQRIKSIREQVLRYLGRNDVRNAPQPTEQQSLILHVIQHQMNVSQWNSDFYTELQSVYPSCDLPRNTDEELWEKGHQMNLHFNLTFPSPGQGSTFSIQWAKLRLYKLPLGNTTMPLMEDYGKGDATDKKNYSHLTSPVAQLPLEEKQLRVSVYWYTKALRKHRVKRKLLDSQMISYYGEAWTEWNVKAAVKAWKELGKNFGISVEVEDEDRVILSASKIFIAMNCSKEANIQQPIPSTLVDTLDNNTQQFIKPFSQLYPVIELSTREYPEADVQYSGIKFPSIKTGEHRLRHHHGQNSDTAVNETFSGAIKWEDPRDTDTDR